MKRMNYMKGDEFAAINDPLTQKVIGLAIQVHTELGSGFLENIYHRALLVELSEASIPFQSGVPLEVKYKGKPLGTFVADLIIEKKLLVELKAVEGICPIHEVQVVNYLRATGLNLGLILNFGASTLQIKRKYREPLKRPSPICLQEV